MGEKWQNLPFLGRTCKSWHRYPLCRGDVVPVPKIWVSVPIDSKGLVPISVKVVPVSMLPATLFLHTLHY